MRWINERDDQIAWMHEQAHDVYENSANALSDYEDNAEAFARGLLDDWLDRNDQFPWDFNARDMELMREYVRGLIGSED